MKLFILAALFLSFSQVHALGIKGAIQAIKSGKQVAQATESLDSVRPRSKAIEAVVELILKTDKEIVQYRAVKALSKFRESPKKRISTEAEIASILRHVVMELDVNKKTYKKSLEILDEQAQYLISAYQETMAKPSVFGPNRVKELKGYKRSLQANFRAFSRNKFDPEMASWAEEIYQELKSL